MKTLEKIEKALAVQKEKYSLLRSKAEIQEEIKALEKEQKEAKEEIEYLKDVLRENENMILALRKEAEKAPPKVQQERSESLDEIRRLENYLTDMGKRSRKQGQKGA